MCVCECVVQQFNSRLLCSVSHVVLVLNVDLFAVRYDQHGLINTLISISDKSATISHSLHLKVCDLCSLG